jgi:hypothetical protein
MLPVLESAFRKPWVAIFNSDKGSNFDAEQQSNLLIQNIDDLIVLGKSCSYF